MSKKKTSPTVLSIGYDGDLPPESYPPVHCPVCGASSSVSLEGKTTVGCNHLTFIRTQLCGEDGFFYETRGFGGHFEKAAARLDEECFDLNSDKFWEVLLSATDYDENFVVVLIPCFLFGLMGQDAYGFDCGSSLNKKLLADRTGALLTEALFPDGLDAEQPQQKKEKPKATSKSAKTAKRPVPKKKDKAPAKSGKAPSRPAPKKKSKAVSKSRK